MLPGYPPRRSLRVTFQRTANWADWTPNADLRVMVPKDLGERELFEQLAAASSFNSRGEDR